MQKRKYIIIALLLGFLMILLAVTFYYLTYQERLAQRHHLLCEVLKPGMSVDEVLGILHQSGEFTLRKSAWLGDNNIELGINFTDPKGRDLYGGFELRFFDSKYAQAYISNFKSLDIICDFSQVIKSVTVTPKLLP